MSITWSCNMLITLLFVIHRYWICFIIVINLPSHVNVYHDDDDDDDDVLVPHSNQLMPPWPHSSRAPGGTSTTLATNFPKHTTHTHADVAAAEILFWRKTKLLICVRGLSMYPLCVLSNRNDGCSFLTGFWWDVVSKAVICECFWRQNLWCHEIQRLL